MALRSSDGSSLEVLQQHSCCPVIYHLLHLPLLHIPDSNLTIHAARCALRPVPIHHHRYHSQLVPTHLVGLFEALLRLRPAPHRLVDGAGLLSFLMFSIYCFDFSFLIFEQMLSARRSEATCFHGKERRGTRAASTRGCLAGICRFSRFAFLSFLVPLFRAWPGSFAVRCARRLFASCAPGPRCCSCEVFTHG